MLYPPLSNYARARQNHLKMLSIVDRVFTVLCQSHLFRELRLDGKKSHWVRTLKKVHEILRTKESSAISFVRCICLILHEQKDLSWLFQDKTFLSLMHILSKAPRPPYGLEIFGRDGAPMTKNPELVVEGLLKSFFSTSLQSLRIWDAQIPASTLTISPTLHHLELCEVQLVDPQKPAATGEHGSRRLPILRELGHRLSFDAVQRMLPGSGARQIADLSRLRVLRSVAS